MLSDLHRLFSDGPDRSFHRPVELVHVTHKLRFYAAHAQLHYIADPGPWNLMINVIEMKHRDLLSRGGEDAVVEGVPPSHSVARMRQPRIEEVKT